MSAIKIVEEIIQAACQSLNCANKNSDIHVIIGLATALKIVLEGDKILGNNGEVFDELVVKISYLNNDDYEIYEEPKKENNEWTYPCVVQHEKWGYLLIALGDFNAEPNSFFIKDKKNGYIEDYCKENFKVIATELKNLE